MYNGSYNDMSSYPVAHAGVDPNQPLPMMLDSHGNAVRVDPSQLRKVKGGYELMEATLSGPKPSQQPQKRRPSGIPQRVPAKIPRTAQRTHKVNMLAPRTPYTIPSTPDTIQSKLSAASTSRTMSVRNSPTTYWHGIPFARYRFLQYAIDRGWEVRKGMARIVDEEETLAAVKDNFFEETGVRLDVRELGRPLPILAFYSNREVDGVTQMQKRHIRKLLLDLGYEKNLPLVWYSRKM